MRKLKPATWSSERGVLLLEAMFGLVLITVALRRELLRLVGLWAKGCSRAANGSRP